MCTFRGASRRILSFLSGWTEPGRCPLAGSSVHADKKFIGKYMPRLGAFLHYRIIDVSSMKSVCKLWFPKQFSKTPKKALMHRASTISKNH